MRSLLEPRGERAAAERMTALAFADSLGCGTARKAPWLARLAARRGGAEGDALELLEQGDPVSRNRAMPGILEARCDVVAELERWDLADEAVAEARAFAERALLDVLPFHADRLAGRAALARGDLEPAADALTRARDGLASFGARWEAAVAGLWLAEALAHAGAGAEARRAVEAALAVFEELRSVRELDEARALVGLLEMPDRKTGGS